MGGTEGSRGSGECGTTHMWKFSLRAAGWNEDVGFGMKIAIS